MHGKVLHSITAKSRIKEKVLRKRKNIYTLKLLNNLWSGVSQGVMKACWDAAGEVIKAWATEGHSVALPGLGNMRFGLRSKAVEKVEDVKTGLISSRRIIFTPSVDLKDELANTSIQITCYDKDGNIVRRVTSTSGEVEDPENQGGENQNGSGTEGGNTNQGGNQGGNTGGGGGGDDSPIDDD